MSEEVVKQEEAPKASVVENIAAVEKKVDGFVDKLLGLIGNHPWEKWTAVASKYVQIFLPLFVGVVGITAFITCLAFSIKLDVPISQFMRNFVMLLIAVVAMYLSTKSIPLGQSCLKKDIADEEVRPELFYVIKVVLGLGGIVFGLYQLLQFSSQTWLCGLIWLGVGVLTVIVTSRPEMVNIKVGAPKSATEELITLVFLPLKAILSLLTEVVGVVSVALYVTGIVCLFDGWMGVPVAIEYMVEAMLIPFMLPLVLYVVTLVVTFVFDLIRAIVKTPQKIDELIKK